MIVAQQNRAYDPAKAVPTLILRNDDYGRVERLLADGEDVKMEFHIVNHVYPEGKTSYNVVGEIPGSDKADEIVMLGGHLDSWHAATGATDNAIGSAIMMEAARLIQALGLKPGGRCASRYGPAKRKDCSGRWRTSNSISARRRIPSRNGRNWIAISMWIPVRAGFAAREFSGRPKPPQCCGRCWRSTPIGAYSV